VLLIYVTKISILNRITINVTRKK